MTSKIIANMTGREVLDALQADSPLSRIARIVNDGQAEIESAANSRNPPSILEFRRMQLDIANRIAALFGVGLE